MASTGSKNRIDWIDCAKGILMLLVIFAHCLGDTVLGDAVRGAVFSFHMPMFFCLSCITFRFSSDRKQWYAKTRKAFSHLIVPAIIVFVHIIIAELLMGKCGTDRYLLKKLLSLLFASGIWYDLPGITVPEIGVIWFLFALFTGRSLYDLLRCSMKRRLFYILSLLIALFGIVAGQYVQLPFSLDVALAVFPFFMLGELFSKLRLGSRRGLKIFLCTAVWVADMLLSYYICHGYFELACRRYTLFPLCYFGAAAGIILVYYFCVWLCGKKRIAVPLKYIGRNSMELLCVHALDFIWSFAWQLNVNEFICACMRVLSDILVFLLIMFIKKRIGGRKANA